MESFKLYKTLRELSVMLSSIKAGERSKNPYKRLARKIELPLEIPMKDALRLYNQLVHGITVLNRLYRHREKGRLVSTREDVVTAIMLMRGLIHRPTMINRKSIDIHWQLSDRFKNQQYFTLRQARILRIPKTTLRRHMAALQKAGLITRVKENRYGGYLYKIEEPSEA